MNKVLIICSNFLPVRNGGSIRCEKLVKYLPEFGWNTTVFTKTTGEQGDLDFDYTLDNTTIYRSRKFDLALFLVNLRSKIKRFFFINKSTTKARVKVNSILVKRRLTDYFLIPDPDIFWAFGAIFKCFSVMRKEKPEIIFSSGPNHSVHILGCFLKKLTKKKWIVEFRDPWTMNPFNIPKPYKILTFLDDFLEKLVLKNADKINVTSVHYKTQFLEKYAFLSDDKIVSIPNGFDPEDFEGIKKIENEKFTIVHSGNFYQHRSSAYFVEAVIRLLKEGALDRNNIAVKFFGVVDYEGLNLINNSEFEDCFQLCGKVSHRESIKQIMNADLLLLIPGPGLGTTPGKFYEYLAASKPIFCSAKEGPTVEYINEYNFGVVSKVYDVEDIASKLKDMIQSIESGAFTYPDITLLKRSFDRRYIAKDMSLLLNQLHS